MNRITKIMALCLPFALQAVAAPAIWDGTADVSWYEGDAQAYNLTTAEQLAGLAQLVNEGTSSFEGKTITLGADIFLNDTTGAAGGTWASVPRTAWTPIGTSAHPFKGEFDGLAGTKKRKIYGLYFNSADVDYAGLFGYTSGVRISNIDVLVGRVIAKNDVGALVGRSVNGSITNVHAEVKVAGVNHVGGLVGYTTGSIDRGSVTENVVGQDSVGGLVGYTSGSVVGTDKSNCYFEGSVTGRKFVGGIAGRGVLIRKSYSDGSVAADSNYVGGIVGYGAGLLDLVYHIGGSVSGFNYVGGVAGEMYYSTAASGGTIRVIKKAYSEADVKGRADVGGLVGSFTLYRSTSSPTSSSALRGEIFDSYAKGRVEGSTYVGGVVGNVEKSYYSSSYSTYITTAIDSSYHTGGEVIGSSNYVGGVVGRINGFVRHVYNENSPVFGLDYVGGVAGYADSAMYNVSSNESVSGRSYIGGIAGHAGGKVEFAQFTGKSVEGSLNYVGGIAGQIQNGIFYSFHKGGNVVGKNFVGGLAGAYRHSNNGVTVYAARESYSIADVKGDTCVGGLFGLDYLYRNASNTLLFKSSIFKSYANGRVDGVQYVGGLVGRSRKGYYSSSYLSNMFVDIDSSYHENGDVIGSGSYVGGVAGLIEGAVRASYNENSAVSGYNYVGGVVGKADSLLENVYANKPVSGSSYVGGVAGFAGYLVKGSHFTGASVIGTSNNVGGLAGFVSSDIFDSRSVGKVSGQDSVGGLVGYVGGAIRGSSAEQSVSGRNTVGGLAGFATKTVDDSYFMGDSVVGIYQVGGLLGVAKGAVDSSRAEANVKGDDNVGGLIGSSYAAVSNSYSIGSVVGDVAHSSAGNDNLGGLIGYAYGGSISKSMSLSDVRGTTKVGGLVGRFDGTSVSQSYAGGNVTGMFDGDPADENGNFYIGGLIGYGRGSVKETYVSGVVKGIEPEPVYTGCLIGYVSSSMTITNSYYDQTLCKVGVEGVDPESGEGLASISGSPAKITADMQSAATFDGWDFDATWKILDKSYPFLMIYSNSLANAVVTVEPLDSYEYDGKEKTPIVTSVTLFGEKLSWETEYTISYENNVNAGEASIKVCGISPYGGCKITNFDITGSAIKPVIDTIVNEVYTGKEIKPTVVVYNGEDVVSASDYSVEYKDNVVVGKATVVVTMKGNYSGTAERTFVIEKAVPTVWSNPIASEISLGSTLSKSNLVGGSANVDGAFVWESPTTIPTIDNEGYKVVFVPADTNNYKKTDAFVVPVTVFDKAHVVVNIGSIAVVDTFVVKGDYLILPEAPDSTGYDFGGWYNDKTVIGVAGDTLTLSADITISGVYSVKKFVIAFVNYNDTILQHGEVAYGVLPKYAGKTPVKTSTAQYSYTFADWTPEVVPVIGEATYTATFDSVVNTYTISFIGAGEEKLQSREIAYGELPKYEGDEPTRKASAQYTYSFAGWDKELVAVVGEAVYTAVFDSISNVYTVTFMNGEDELQSSEVAYGVVPEYEGDEPTKAATEKTTYTFAGWDKELVAVVGEAVYTAVFDSISNVYTVTFMNGEDELQSSEVAYGVVPEYEGEEPTKKATAQYTYTFAGWDKKLVAVVGETVYTAVFDSVVNKYAVAFMNGEEELQSSEVAYGVVPEYEGDEPTKAATEKTTYTFAGWDKELVAVVGEAVYTAVFDSISNVYTVTFMNGEDELQSSEVAYGVVPEYEGEEPTKKATAQYTYTFAGWSPKIVAVAGDATYKAVYDSAGIKYAVAFVDYDGSELQSDELLYGATPKYAGKTPSRTATAQYTYSFVGWTPKIADVSGNATYKAVYDSTVNEYVVSFLDVEGDELQSGKLAYGSTPKYEGDTPVKAATAGYTYKFTGWTPEISKVTKNATYKATFDSTVNKYMVSFVDADGKELQSNSVAYGAVPEYKGETPNRDATVRYTYKFTGWTPKVVAVVGEATYKAVYDSASVKYAVSFVNFNGDTLQLDELLYEATPVYAGKTPTRTATAQYTYKFTGWDKKIVSVTGAATYKAVYDSTVNKYVVSFVDYNGSKLQLDTLAYGSTPSYKGKALSREKTKAYVYEFVGWSPKLTSVTGSVTYKAVYDSTIIKYAVTFKQGDKVVQKGDVAYGTIPSYSGKTPHIDSTAQYSYRFVGWSPNLVAVTDSVTYTAVFDSTVRVYQVRFRNGDKVLQTNMLAYGEMPEYHGKTPARTGTLEYDFKFSGWSPKIAAVEGKVEYEAVFDSIKIDFFAINDAASIPHFDVTTVNRDVQISGARVGSVFALLDMQGRVMLKGRVNAVNFNLTVPQAGSYFIRIGDRTQRVNVK